LSITLALFSVELQGNIQFITHLRAPEEAKLCDNCAQRCQAAGTGAGCLMPVSVEDAKPVNPNIKLGIGGDPNSVKFRHKLGLNYVSC
jgi:hypothetical protein